MSLNVVICFIHCLVGVASHWLFIWICRWTTLARHFTNRCVDFRPGTMVTLVALMIWFSLVPCITRGWNIWLVTRSIHFKGDLCRSSLGNQLKGAHVMVAFDSGRWKKTAHFLKERSFDQSDTDRVHVCEHCGFTAFAYLKNNSLVFRGRKNKNNIVQVYYLPSLLNAYAIF